MIYFLLKLLKRTRVLSARLNFLIYKKMNLGCVLAII